ncbi:unnamed protein product [Laminaria digitata]
MLINGYYVTMKASDTRTAQNTDTQAGERKSITRNERSLVFGSCEVPFSFFPLYPSPRPLRRMTCTTVIVVLMGRTTGTLFAALGCSVFSAFICLSPLTTVRCALCSFPNHPSRPTTKHPASSRPTVVHREHFARHGRMYDMSSDYPIVFSKKNRYLCFV